MGSLGAALLPHPGLYVAMGLGTLSMTLGFAAYRGTNQSAARLRGALALTIGAVGLAVGVGRFAVTLWALFQMARLAA